MMPLGHLGVNVADLPRAKAFYDVLMPMLEFEPYRATDTEFSYRPAHAKIGTWLFFYQALVPGEHSRHRPGLQHMAFMVRTRDAVHEVREVAVAAGASVVHEPQEYPQYHEGNYSVFLRDVDGFMIEIVCHH